MEGVASQYGVLRSEGLTERAILVIDKQGVIRYIDVHDINTKPALNPILEILAKINK